MKQYEYRIEEYGLGRSIRTYLDKEKADWRKDYLEYLCEKMNDFGSQGWEVVQHVTGDPIQGRTSSDGIAIVTYTTTITLKREKEATYR